MRLNSLNRDLLNHFVLIEVCSVDILVACLRICTGFIIRTETITNENLENLFCFRFRNGKANKFAFVSVVIMLGTHKPQQQATLTKSIKIPEIFFRFRFRNSTDRKS